MVEARRGMPARSYALRMQNSAVDQIARYQATPGGTVRALSASGRVIGSARAGGAGGGGG